MRGWTGRSGCRRVDSHRQRVLHTRAVASTANVRSVQCRHVSHRCTGQAPPRVERAGRPAALLAIQMLEGRTVRASRLQRHGLPPPPQRVDRHDHALRATTLRVHRVGADGLRNGRGHAAKRRIEVPTVRPVARGRGARSGAVHQALAILHGARGLPAVGARGRRGLKRPADGSRRIRQPAILRWHFLRRKTILFSNPMAVNGKTGMLPQNSNTQNVVTTGRRQTIYCGSRCPFCFQENGMNR